MKPIASIIRDSDSAVPLRGQPMAVARIFLSLLLALSLIYQVAPRTADAAAADGTYDFSGISGTDSGGSGFSKISNGLFVVSNGFAQDGTRIWSENQQTANTTGTLTIKAEGGVLNKTFTFQNLGISAYDNIGLSLESISVTLYNSSGGVIRTISSGLGQNIALTTSVVQLGSLLNGGSAYNDANVASLTFNWHFNNTSAPSNLNIENITISNVQAASPAWTATASAATATPTVGVDDAITLTVKDSTGSTDTSFSGARNVTVSGYTAAPNGSYGSYNGTALTASPTTVSVSFANGVATSNLRLNKASAQTVAFSIAGVNTPATNTVSITPVAGSAASMAVTTNVAAPASNGGSFAQQPAITLRDTFGNTSVGDNSTTVTVSKSDAGSWTLTGTATRTAASGVVTFSGLGATNAAAVTGAQLAFNAGGLTQVLSSAVNLPAPTGAWTATSSAATGTPAVGANDAITLTVKNSVGNTDTTFTGAHNVTVSGYSAAPNGSYGSFNGTALTASPNTISVSFVNGVATPNLQLNKASSQTIGFSIAGVSTPATNTVSLTPAAGSAASMEVTTNVTAPPSNGGSFAQQPVITLRDAFGNTSVGDSTTVVTTSKSDGGAWTLTGTATRTAANGVVTFSSLGAANVAAVTGAQLAFDASGLTQVLSGTVNLPAPAGAWTVSAAAATLTPDVGVDDAVTLTVKDALGNTDTSFSGAHNVTVSGYTAAPDGSYGSFNGTALTASPNTISVTFTNGAAMGNLRLNKAASQAIGFSVAGVNTPAANTVSITPVAGSAASMAVTTNVTAPSSNGGTFAQQPVITLRDAFGNTSVSDSTTAVTASKFDGGTWTLIGTLTRTATSGVVTFSDLGATNVAAVTGAQLAFNTVGLTQVSSGSVNLPAPAGAWTASAAAATLTPVAGADDAITLTVKNSLGNTDTSFTGAHNVTVSGYTAAPDGSYGSFNGTALTASPNTISVTFTNGAATVNLRLNKAASQTIGFSVAGLNTPAANTLTIVPAIGITSMGLTTGVTAPSSNGGSFAQQPVITLRDAFGNIDVNDNTTSVTVSKVDANTWTLTGTKTVSAVAGVVAFSDLGATNAAAVTGAQLAFDASGLTQVLSGMVNLPAPAGAWTASAAAATLTPVVGADDAITLTVKNSLGNTDTSFAGAHNVTVSGYTAAPDGSYGSFNGTALSASPNTISVTFTNGAATVNLRLNKAASQTIGFSVAGVNTPATNTLTIEPAAGDAASMAVTTNVNAPSSNGGSFAQQPVITLIDAFGNTSVGDSTTVVSAVKADGGTWTLTGTLSRTADSGVVTFTDLGATNEAAVTDAQLAFDASGLTQVLSGTVNLPAPAGAWTASAAAATLTPNVGDDDVITLTVKDELGNTDTSFTGVHSVIVSGYLAAPDGTYGSFNGTALMASPNTISVNFTNGVATVSLQLNKAASQTIGFSVAGVNTPAANTLTIVPAIGITSMVLTTGVAAPSSNGGMFAQQPVITFRDAFGNVDVNDNTTSVTVSKADANRWTLTGTKTETAVAGVVTFSGLGATNAAAVTGAQLAFDASGLTQVLSSTVNLPAPAGAWTASAAAATLTPDVGVDDVITLTVKDELGNTDTSYTGVHDVTVSGYTEAPDGTYGSFNGTALTASPNAISVTFTNGVATVNLQLNYAASQTIGFSVAGVNTSATNTLTVTPAAGSAVSMMLTTNIVAPSTNGGKFAQQPVVKLFDAYGNISVNDHSTSVTASKKDGGSWSLSGTATKTASAGIVAFTNLAAANAAAVNGAQLAFNASGLTEIVSSAVNLPTRRHSGGSSGEGTSEPDTGAEVLVNGKPIAAGKITTTTVNGKIVTTLVVDQSALDSRLEAEGPRAVITIMISSQSDVIIAELNGQMIKKIEQKQGILKIVTKRAGYEIDSKQINMDAIAGQLGGKKDLQDIKIQIEIGIPTDDVLKVVERSAVERKFVIVVPPLEFLVRAIYGNQTVEISKFSGYVERTIAIPEGVDPKKITTGIVIDPDGNVRHVPTKIVFMDGMYYAVIKSMTNSVYSIVWHPVEFSDVSAHWAQAAINDMGSRMIAQGTSNGLFNPDQDVTRAEFVAILVRGLGLKLEDGNRSFSDVHASDWYSSAVQTAVSYGLISGYNDGRFHPMDNITREQAMTIIAKAMTLSGLKEKLKPVDAADLLRAFTDADNVAKWAQESISECLQAGIVSGRTGNKLAPQGTLTRAEAAIMVQKLLQKSELI